MKTKCRIFLWSMALLMPFMTLSQTNLVLKGQIKGLADSLVITLADANQADAVLGTTKAADGKFVLRAQLKEPMLVLLMLGPDKTVTTFLNGSNVSVTGDLANLDGLKWKGSTAVADFAAFKKTFDPLFSRLMSLNQQVRQTGWSDTALAKMGLYKDSIQRAIDVFIARRKSSPVSTFLLAATYQLNDDVFLTDRRFKSLKPEATNNLYGNYLRETIASEIQTAVGATAMDFTQTDTAGNPVSLSSFRGKYVLLDFWASWCGPCRQENPNVVASFQKFRNKNFTVLGVSLDRPGQKDKWLQAIYADGLTWTHVSDLQFWNNEVAQQYKVQGIPQNFLIGPDGKILAKNLRGPGLEAKLCELLGCE